MFNFENKICYNSASGYVTLISVLVISAISVSITISLLLLGLSSSRSSLAAQQSYQAKSFANACAEEALQQVRNWSAYTGTDNMIFGQGRCDYTVGNSGPNKIIDSYGTVDTVVRKIKLTINVVGGEINIISWQEVADF